MDDAATFNKMPWAATRLGNRRCKRESLPSWIGPAIPWPTAYGLGAVASAIASLASGKGTKVPGIQPSSPPYEDLKTWEPENNASQAFCACFIVR